MEMNNKTGSDALIYGMQRTASNYIEQLLVQNFTDLNFCNDSYSRCLPTHKHFRLYDEKAAIPQAKYLNSFTYNDFGDFRNHVEQISKRKIRIFIVTVKDPYSWYVSYQKFARKNGYVFFRKHVNSHFIVDYNLFYRKWFEFSIQAPDEVLFVKYEDILGDLDMSLERIRANFGIEKIRGSIVNPDKVFMSKRFSEERMKFYKQGEYLEMISQQDRDVIGNLLDAELMNFLKY